MHTQFDEHVDNKALLVDGGAEVAGIDFEQTPDMPGGEAEGFGANDSETRDDSGEDEKREHDAVAAVGVADDVPTAATELTEEHGLSATADASDEEVDSGSSTDSMANSSSADEPVSDAEQTSPQFYKEALEVLVDESTGDLVAMEDFGREVNVKFYRRFWFGSHWASSLATFQVEHHQKGKCTAHVDEAGSLISDPDVFLLAKKDGVPITLCVHRGLTEDQKIEFMLRQQARYRFRTEDEERKLKNAWIEVQIRLGFDYETIAEMARVHANTVRNVEKRAAANSKLGNTKRPDGRFKPETLEKIAEAHKLRKEGMGDKKIAAIFNTHVESVGRWFKDPPALDKAKIKAKLDKKPKTGRATSRMQPATDPIEDIAASDGVPKPHRRALEHLGQNARVYAEWLKEAAKKARQDSEPATDNVEESVKSELYFMQRAEVEKSRQRQILSSAGEVDVEEAPGDSCPELAGPTQVGDILLGIVKSIEQDEASVVLPVGGGVIDNRDDCLDRHAPLKLDEVVRVRVEGFDWKRGLWKLQPLARQTVAPAPGAIATGSDHDERCSPDTKLAGLRAGPKEFRA